MSWVITEDHLDSGFPHSRVGTGREDINQPIQSNLKESIVTDPIKIKLFDDDGELYYEGIISREWFNKDELYCFDPLHFAANDAGCTYMQYEDNGQWNTL